MGVALGPKVGVHSGVGRLEFGKSGAIDGSVEVGNSDEGVA